MTVIITVEPEADELEDLACVAYLACFKEDVLKSIIYVFTPKGDVIELPAESTPVDFAYKVHTEVGDKMVGAIVNDSIVPFDYQLKNGDIIRINTSKLAKGPNKDWLNFVTTTQAPTTTLEPMTTPGIITELIPITELLPILTSVFRLRQ